WSCIAFLVAGWVLWTNGRLWALSVVTLLVGVIPALEYFTGVTTRFDTLLFPQSLLTTVRYPGRPAPLMSFAFLLIGAACLVLPVRRTVAIVLREFSAVITITLAYLALLEYMRAGITREGAISPVGVALSLLTAFGILIVAPEKRLLPLIRD